MNLQLTLNLHWVAHEHVSITNNCISCQCACPSSPNMHALVQAMCMECQVEPPPPLVLPSLMRAHCASACCLARALVSHISPIPNHSPVVAHEQFSCVMPCGLSVTEHQHLLGNSHVLREDADGDTSCHQVRYEVKDMLPVPKQCKLHILQALGSVGIMMIGFTCWHHSHLCLGSLSMPSLLKRSPTEYTNVTPYIRKRSPSCCHHSTQQPNSAR